jgi:hypothetical protein
MKDKIRVIQYGLGPIGSAIARLVAERDGLELVGGVDIDRNKIGNDVGEVIGLGHRLGIDVVEKLAQVKIAADLVMHTTSSYFDVFMDQIIEILEAGLDIVSTSEELSFPILAHSDEAARVDLAAKNAKKRVLGTGVNPGFLMDSLPLFLTSICQQVDHIEVTRNINASMRRRPFQAKIGAGMTVEEFNANIAAGRMGHVGLPESTGMVFDTLGKRITRYTSDVEPVVADRLIKTDCIEVQPGEVRGLKQVARGYTQDGEFMTLTFIAALEAGDDGDTIKIKGKPDLTITLNGTNGDLATAAIAVNAIRRLIEAEPGLLTMRDLPIVTVF